VGNDTVCPF